MVKYKRGDLRNIGLLILRFGIGIMFILHGYPMMFGGPEVWAETGTAVQYLGLDFAPMFFGFMAGVVAFFGGIFLMLGLFFTPSVLFLMIMMIVATIQNLATAEEFLQYSHSIEMTILFFSLLFIGPGRYNLDRKIQDGRRRTPY